jgi:chitodextrinase
MPRRTAALIVMVLAALLCTSAGGAPQRGAASGLVAAYAFSEATGATVLDASGNGNTGTIAGATRTTAGRFGSALSFNGTNAWVTVPDSVSLHLSAGMTLEAWVRPTSLTGWRAAIVKEQPGELVYALYASSDTNTPTGIVYVGGAERYSRGSAKVSLNAWTHLATTYDGAAVRIYVNGVQAGSTPQTGAITLSTNPLRMGGDSVWGEYLTGLIDEVRVYNRALSAAEIQADMNTAIGADTTPPSPPTGLVQTEATASTVSLAWTASTDNVGVAGYGLYRGGVSAGTATTPSGTLGGLACGTTYTVGVDAFDAAGNRSGQTTLGAATTPCDTTPPSPVTGLVQSGATAASVSVAWSVSTDDVGVAGYGLYRDGLGAGTVTTTSATFGGLRCGTSTTIGVDAFDAAGNRSGQTTLGAATSACDLTAPTVELNAPPDGATVSGAAVDVSATATDDVGVAGVRFRLDGADLGPEDTTAPYAASWNTTTAANGSHVLTAVARDAAGNTATSTPATVTVSNAFDTTNAFKRVDVGPGSVDASTRAVVRTPAGRVYIFSSDDTAQRQGTGPGVIRAWKGDQPGIPTSFTEVDGAGRPSATGTTHVLTAPDVRLDANGVVQLVFANETDRTLVYKTFSTTTDTWGPSTVIASGVTVPTTFIKRESVAAIVLDQTESPHVVYAAGASLLYRNRAGGSWSAPVTIATGNPLHPQLALDASGVMHVAWLDDGTSPVVRYARRAADGTWGASEVVASTDVLGNSNSDQGPSIVVASSGTPYVLYVSALPGSSVRVSLRSPSGWASDNPAANVYTHTPQIYGRSGDVYVFLGHDVNIHYGYLYQLSGQPWSPPTVLSTEVHDGSASIRWDPLRETNAGIIDTSYFDEDRLHNNTFLPEAYYMAIVPGSTTAPPDTTPPSVSVSAPAPGATVSGTAVAVSAAASDDIGVAGVQFRLDGADLVAEDTTPPYSVVWDSTKVANGSHTLGAVARDPAGNVAAAPAVTVTVANAAPPPAPIVLLGDQQVEPQADSNAAGKAEAFRATASASGTLTKLRVYVDSGSSASKLVVGLYANAGAHPGALLTQGSLTAPVTGAFNEVIVPGVSVVQGTTYWIAILGATGTLRFRDRCCSGAASETSSQTTLTALPATWATGTVYTDGPLSAYGLG